MDDLFDSLHALLKRMARHRYRKREVRFFHRRSFKTASQMLRSGPSWSLMALPRLAALENWCYGLAFNLVPETSS